MNTKALIKIFLSCRILSDCSKRRRREEANYYPLFCKCRLALDKTVVLLGYFLEQGKGRLSGCAD